MACSSSRGVSAVSRQAEAPSDGRRGPGSSSTCASRCILTPSGAEKRSRCTCVAAGRRRPGAPQSFCHAFAQLLRLRILPAVDELRDSRQNQSVQRSDVEPGLPGMRRAAVHRGAPPSSSPPSCGGVSAQRRAGARQVVCNLDKYTVRNAYITH